MDPETDLKLPTDVEMTAEQAAAEPQGGEGAEPEATGEGAEAKPKDESAQLRKQLHQQAARIRELERSESYWAGVAGRGSGGQEVDQPDSDDDDLGEFGDLLETGDGDDGKAPDPDPTADEFVEELSKGPQALDKLLAKRGYVRASDVRREVVKLASEISKRQIAKRVGTMAIDARLSQEFGELKSDDSPLFQEAKGLYQDMVKLDPSLARSPAAVLLVAKAAKGILAAKERDNGRRREPADQELGDSERTRRIRAQQGETGAGRRQDLGDLEDDMGAEARYLANSWARTAKMKPDELLGALRADRQARRGR